MPAPPAAVPFWAWIVLAVVVAVSVSVDLFGHRGDHGHGKKKAVLWSLGWLGVSAAFAIWVYAQLGPQSASEFTTAWLVEKSLSIDNLFVFVLVFARMKIPEAEQHRVLFWGIIGALVTRGAFIAGGTTLLAAWHGIVYPMGAFLVYTGIKSAIDKPDAAAAKGEGKILGFLRRRVPYTDRLHGHHFFVYERGLRVATPLFLACAVIEITDVIFAVDSIPAVFAVTTDPFIVYSSNVFAILGLRALYLVIATLLRSLPLLRFGLAAILVFAGAKMLTSSFIHVPHWASLSTIVGILLVTIAAGMLVARSHRRALAL